MSGSNAVKLQPAYSTVHTEDVGTALRQQHSTNISGTIPAEWDLLTALTYCSMYSQPISGTLGSFSTLTSLNEIKLGDNSISGTVTNLAHLTALQNL